MKRRIYSILFLALISFNAIGYYCLFLIDKQKTERFASIIEDNANEISGNMIFRFPMDFPNPEAAKNFRPVDGEITYEGELYHLVKQKLYQDTLYVVCIKDTQTKEVRQVIHDYAESFTDHPVSTNTGLKLFNLLSKDFISSLVEIDQDRTCWTRTLNFAIKTDLYHFTPLALVFQPPQLHS